MRYLLLHSCRDDSAVYLAGLGTVGMEIYEQVPKLDAVIIPAGGQCGLLAGTAAAIKHLNPNISVIVSVLALHHHRKSYSISYFYIYVDKCTSSHY